MMITRLRQSSRWFLFLVLIFSIALPPSFANRTPRQAEKSIVTKKEKRSKQHKRSKHLQKKQRIQQTNSFGFGIVALSFLLVSFILIAVAGYLGIWQLSLTGLILYLSAYAIFAASLNGLSSGGFGDGMAGLFLVIIGILILFLLGIAALFFIIHGAILMLPWLWIPNILFFILGVIMAVLLFQ